MDETLFISDCHLTGDNTESARRLIDFLENRTQHAKALYILGDLFEVWLGDDDPVEIRNVVEVEELRSANGMKITTEQNY